MLRMILALSMAASLAACATGTTKLDLAYPAASAKAGVLSEAPSTKVDVADVADQRSQVDRIGDKRNGYGMVMGSIASTQPPTEIVEAALENVLKANGHVLGAEGDRFALQTNLKTFWFDYKTGLVTVEFYGSVQADVALVDRVSGQTLYTETFDGYASEKTGGGLSATWTRIMNAALADLAQKVGLSDGLKDALASTHEAGVS